MLWQFFLDVLSPQRCLYCDQLSERIEAICSYCETSLQPNDQPCSRCALPQCGGTLCPQCQNTGGLLDLVSAPYIYDEAISYLIAQWKFRGKAHLAHTVAALMLRQALFDSTRFEDRLSTSSSALLPTPLHWRRQWQRGFNQSEDLMHALLRLRPELQSASDYGVRLKRRRATTPQAQSSRSNRLRKLQGVFEVVGNAEGHSFILIDDVCTTGATGEAMASALIQAGAENVALWCFARTPAR